MSELNSVIHQPVRLKIVAALVSLDETGRVDFAYLRDLLKLTDGNLGAHLTKLEEAGYLNVEKTFEGKKPRTYLALTVEGRTAFAAHVKALQEIIALDD